MDVLGPSGESHRPLLRHTRHYNFSSFRVCGSEYSLITITDAIMLVTRQSQQKSSRYPGVRDTEILGQVTAMARLRLGT